MPEDEPNRTDWDPKELYSNIYKKKNPLTVRCIVNREIPGENPLNK